MVPSLLMIFNMNILDANATSLAAMLLPVGILGVLAYHKSGNEITFECILKSIRYVSCYCCHIYGI